MVDQVLISNSNFVLSDMAYGRHFLYRYWLIGSDILDIGIGIIGIGIIGIGIISIGIIGIGIISTGIIGFRIG